MQRLMKYPRQGGGDRAGTEVEAEGREGAALWRHVPFTQRAVKPAVRSTREGDHHTPRLRWGRRGTNVGRVEGPMVSKTGSGMRTTNRCRRRRPHPPTVPRSGDQGTRGG